MLQHLKLLQLNWVIDHDASAYGLSLSLCLKKKTQKVELIFAHNLVSSVFSILVVIINQCTSIIINTTTTSSYIFTITQGPFEEKLSATYTQLQNLYNLPKFMKVLLSTRCPDVGQ